MMHTTSTRVISSSVCLVPGAEDCPPSADNTKRGKRMTLQTLSATSRWNLFKIEGLLDAVAAPTVATALAHAATLDHSDVLIDLEDVTGVDEVGVEQLLGAVRRLLSEHAGRQVAFVAKDLSLANMLASSQLPTAVVTFRSGSEALHAIKRRTAA